MFGKNLEHLNFHTFSSQLSIEEYAKSYLRHYEKKFIENHFFRGAKILDVGCGCGRTTSQIFQLGWQNVIGVDNALPLIEKAQQLYPDIEFTVMDVRDLHYEDESFDIIFFSFNGLDYLYPLSERKKALQEMHRVARQNGIIAYTSHNACNIPRTKIGVKTFIRNLFNARALFSDYRLERNPFGDLITYYKNPLGEIKQTERTIPARLKDIYLQNGDTHKNFFRMMFLEKFPLYIFRKI